MLPPCNHYIFERHVNIINPMFLFSISFILFYLQSNPAPAGHDLHRARSAIYILFASLFSLQSLLFIVLFYLLSTVTLWTSVPLFIAFSFHCLQFELGNLKLKVITVVIKVLRPSAITGCILAPSPARRKWKIRRQLMPIQTW